MRTFIIKQSNDEGETVTVAEGLEPGDGRAIVTFTATPGMSPEVTIFSSVDDLRTAYVDVPMSRLSFHWSDE